MTKIAYDEKNNDKSKGRLIGAVRRFSTILVIKFGVSLFLCFLLYFLTTGCCFAKDLDINTVKSLFLKKTSIGRLSNKYSAIKLHDGRVLISGGYATKFFVLIFPVDIPMNQSQIYNNKTKKLSIGPNMIFSRFCHSSLLLPDGRVFIYGGYYYDEIFKISKYSYRAEFYNPDTNAFTSGPNMINNIMDGTGIGDNYAWFIDEEKQYLCIFTLSGVNLYDLKNDKIYAIDAIHYDYKTDKFIGTNTITGFEDKALEKDLMEKMKKHPVFLC